MSKWKESIIFVIYLPPPFPLLLFFPSFHFPPSTPLSCCFWLLVGVRRRQINRRACLSLPVGNSSALLTLHYLALGYLNPLIYYGEHGSTLPSTGDGTSSISHRTRSSFTHTHTHMCFRAASIREHKRQKRTLRCQMCHPHVET